MAHLLIFLLIAHLPIFPSSNSIAILAAESTNESNIDLLALLDFKQGIISDPFGALSTWHGPSADFCGWRGVICGKALPIRVVSLELNSLQLAGELSCSLTNLTSLAHLDLGNNSFSGGIPGEFGALPELQSLMLANNILSGGIPHSLATSSSLAVLNVTNNRFSGTIPDGLFNGSHKLVIVDLERNSFFGPIPDFYGMVSLRILNLAKNNLSGHIPPSLGNVSSLTKILLDTNNLAGLIPETVSGIRNLSVLTLDYNNLQGLVPAELYNISSLRIFSLGQNSLIGRIPSNIGNSLPNLETFIMRGNMIKGLIPASLANASKLEIIDLSNNLLAGPVPSLGSLSSLRLLHLGSNFLVSDNWAFITSLKNCSNLQMLSMYQNSLDGNLSASIGNLSSSLQLLNLRKNQIVGTIPGVIKNLVSLVSLNLAQNQIIGTLPEEIGNLQTLQLLAMDQNSISGEIPSTIGNLSNLVTLSLSQNRLMGQVTPAVGNLTQLSLLSLDSNSLTGNMPTSLGLCTKLIRLNLSFNSLDGYIPNQLFTITTLVSLDLSYNDFIGSIPQVGTLINLLVLNISYNRLSGQIPSSLGQCLTLSSFHMGHNRIGGIIPQSFTNLKAIQQIDFSQNNLTGTIPDYFNSFTTLEQLDLSYNNFVGPVPTSGYFRNSSIVSLDGNANLCSSVSMLELPVCPVTSIVKRRNFLIMLIVIPTITIVLLFLFFVVTFMKKRAYTIPCYRETMKKVSYGDILKATNWFSPINKISSSHTGSIYIGRFEFDTDFVAIKVFHLDEHGSLNSFLLECEVLKNTRHRNIMKAVTVCSAVDLENNEFKAIVFDFMANGSLDMWVHPKLSHQESPKRGLSLGQRLRIAMDVASALDYMHNQLTPPLIHCDVKPANVLLDYDMTAARVGDFGSAKFLISSLASTEGFVGMGGTIGYIAPEYGMGYKLSTGCDVYSFGVLLLEMFTGKRPTDAMFTGGLSLHALVHSAYPNGLCEVLDPFMFLEGHHACAKLVMQRYLVPIVEVALLCSMESPKDRPTMQDVCAKIFAINKAFLESW